ncbi:MAG: hypothetical protein U0992_04065 [Planctomycetaceae bacterium]
MPNNLTGGFDAVVEIGLRQIDGLLARLHQKGQDEQNPFVLLHSARLRIGDPHRRFPDVIDFGDWVLEYSRAQSDVRPQDVQGHLTSTAPPGAASRMQDVFSKFGLQVVDIPPAVVRGKVEAQISSPKLSVPAGSTTEITVHVNVRAIYTPDPGTLDLPQPVHGEVQATFEVHTTTTPTGRRLSIRPSPQDSKIVFVPAPGAGLSAADAATLSTQVRKAVRESIQLLPVDLPAGFEFSEFRGLGSGTGQVLALPLQLSNAAPPTGGVHNVSNVFIDTAGFAFAISKEFVTHVFQPTINQLLQFQQDFEVDIPLAPNPTYHFAVTSVHLEFNAGTIDLVIHGKATHGVLPDFNNIVIRQRFALAILFNWLFIRASEFDPQVSGLSISVGPLTYNLPTGAVKDAVRSQRDQTLPAAEIAINQNLRDALAKLNNALHAFDPASQANFRSGFSNESVTGASNGVAITPDGIVVRGDISASGSPPPPHVEITAMEPGKTYCALNSWIPGGQIDRLVWTWVEGSPVTPWRGAVKTHVDEHRYVLTIPPPPVGPAGAVFTPQVQQVCLRLEGSRTLANGSTQPITGGSTCHVPAPETVMDVPSWWEPVTVPHWRSGGPDDRPAREAVAAHVTVQSVAPANGYLSRNTLVCFVDWNAAAPLSVVADALSHVKRNQLALAVIVVLPKGAFDHRRDELERRLQSERIPLPLQITEDDEGGWTRTFGPPRVPALFLLNARREFVWQSSEHLDAKALAHALDQHLVPAPELPRTGLRLSVAVGQCAPDASFSDGNDQFAMHRLRGRTAMLNFWQSWSAPCLRELQRLQALHSRKRDAPFIVASPRREGSQERRTSPQGPGPGRSSWHRTPNK